MWFRSTRIGDLLHGFFGALELWSFGALEGHKPEAGGFCLDLTLIIRGVSSKRTAVRGLKSGGPTNTTTEILRVTQNDDFGGCGPWEGKSFEVI